MTGPASVPAPEPAGPRRTAHRGWQALRWYLREWSGEARWDDYLRQCAEHGHAPVTRREFERRRSAAAERVPISRCC